jgi:putative polyhydroxyalkanoate system protein
MSTISIRRSHKLAQDAARERVSHVADRLAERFGARCHWQGDVLKIEHGSVNGHIALAPGEIVVEAKLGLGMRFFRTAIEGEIARLLDRELGA